MESKTNIALLIPYFNCPKDLYDSLESIREDIMIDILIVDDGSNVKFDESKVRKIYNQGIIQFHYLEKNRGIGVALNEGLSILKPNYKYIGRLDCGDYCRKNRFAIQLAYLEKNEDLALVGSWASIINEKKEELYVLKHPTGYKEIMKKMYLNNTFVHPSVVFRSKVLDKIGNYPYEYRFASQDYAFFFRIAKNYKVENLPEVLVDYVISPNSISTKKRKLQVKNRIRIILDNFYIGFYPIYGLTRNMVLLFIPRWATTLVKQVVK